MQVRVEQANRYDSYLKLAFRILIAATYIDILEANHIAYIAGGRESKANYWPWMASIEFYNVDYGLRYHICGGSLIGRDVVITAAHCVKYGTAKDYTVIFGQHDRMTNTGKEQRKHVKEIIIHEDYHKNEPGLPNDIALMKLTTQVEFNHYVQPVPLARSGQHFLTNRDCWITGWGKISYNSYSAVALQQADIPIIDNNKCKSLFTVVKNAAILDTHICAYDEIDHKAACKGDSGGPLVCKDDGIFVLVGVTTWGVGTCQYFPSVFTRVSKYRSWITSNL